MGGTPIQPIKCANYYDAEHVDKEFLHYLEDGIEVVVEEMGVWTWFWWFHWMYAWFIQDYLDTMKEIIICSISNNVEGSKFGNDEFLKNVFQRHYDELYDDYFYYANTLWHPLM